jgi:cold shock protein
MSSNKECVTQSAASEHLTGRIKWFNNKAGYGFITVTDGPRSGSDIFVHHSAINVENQQYKYLVQGEYVEFDLLNAESGKHEFHATSVSGIRGGKLMCETRREFKIARTEYKTAKSPEEPSMPRQKNYTPRARGEGPRDSNRANNSVEARRVQKPRGRPPRSSAVTSTNNE